MQSGTAIGLLVGGAVLLLAVTPHQAQAISAGGVPAQHPGGVLNPFNWFAPAAQNPNAIFQQPQLAPAPQSYRSPAYNQPGGYQNANFSPYATPNVYSSPAYTGAPGAGMGTAANMVFPVMTPAGGFQSMAYQSPAPGGMQAAAATSPAATAAQNWA
jgi:hypothetical protein